MHSTLSFHLKVVSPSATGKYATRRVLEESSAETGGCWRRRRRGRIGTMGGGGAPPSLPASGAGAPLPSPSLPPVDFRPSGGAKAMTDLRRRGGHPRSLRRLDAVVREAALVGGRWPRLAVGGRRSKTCTPLAAAPTGPRDGPTWPCWPSPLRARRRTPPSPRVRNRPSPSRARGCPCPSCGECL
jgi:hypothetical protein